MDVASFFLFFFFSPTISALPHFSFLFLFFLSPYFGNPIAIIQFFFSFPSIFGNGIAANLFYFFPFRALMHGHGQLGRRNFGNTVAEILKISLSSDWIFSLILFFEFRQHCCRNSLSLLISPNNLE